MEHPAQVKNDMSCSNQQCSNYTKKNGFLWWTYVILSMPRQKYQIEKAYNNCYRV